MKPLPKPTQPFEIVTLDFIPKLPPSRWMGKVYDTILVMVDPLTKYVIYVPTIDRLNAEDFATVIYDTLVKYFTVPRYIVSDRAQLFTSPFWTTLCWHLGAKRKLSTAFHPRTDGQTERQNQTLEHYLRCYCNFEQDNWAGLLGVAQRVYNDSKHSVTGVSPTEALMGFRGEMRINVDDPPQAVFTEQEGRQARSNRELATKYARLAQEKRTLLQDVLRRASESQAKYFNEKRIDMQFKIGEWVMLRTKNITPPGGSKKFDSKQIGPFQIIDTWNNAYKLLLPPRYRQLHPVFHVSLLEPHRDSARTTNPPEGILVNDNIEYEVEEIRMDKKNGRGPKSYLVKWKGYSDEECTWEPEAHVADTEALERYLKKPNPLRRGRKRQKTN